VDDRPRIYRKEKGKFWRGGMKKGVRKITDQIPEPSKHLSYFSYGTPGGLGAWGVKRDKKKAK